MIPNSRYMQAAGQQDPREDFIRFLARVGRPLLYRPAEEFFGLPEWEYRLIETYYDNAAAAIAHLEDSGAMRTAHQPDWASYNDLPEDKGRFGRVIFNVDEERRARQRPRRDRSAARLCSDGRREAAA